MTEQVGISVEQNPQVQGSPSPWYWDSNTVGFPYGDPHMPAMFVPTFPTGQGDFGATYPKTSPTSVSDPYWHEMHLPMHLPTSGSITVKNFGQWGRRPDWTQGTKPSFFGRFTLNIAIGTQWFAIPNLWIQNDVNNYYRVNSNMGDYKYIQTWVADQSMQVYGYLYGDEKCPYLLTIMTAKSDRSDNVLTQAKLEGPIIQGNTADPEAWFTEFNWRLAKHRDETASTLPNGNGPMQDPTGRWGWLFDVNKFIKDPHNPTRTYDANTYLWAKPYDINKNLPCKALVPIDIHVEDVDADYINRTVLQNGLDTPMAIRTADYAHAIADQKTYKWSMSQKLTAKFTYKATVEGEAGISFIVKEKAKVEIGFEVGLEIAFTEEWSRSWTDTRTWTALGQTITVGSKAAVELTTAMTRVKARGTFAMLCKLPDQQPMVAGSFAPGSEGVGWTEPLVDLPAIAKALGMTGFVQNPKVDDKTLDGCYWRPVMGFVCDNAVEGSYDIRPGIYKP